MAAKVKEAIGAEAELIRSAGGKFEVVVDGQLVYSKQATKEFPNEDALVGQLQEMT